MSRRVRLFAAIPLVILALAFGWTIFRRFNPAHSGLGLTRPTDDALHAPLTMAPAGQPPVLIAAGDIATCGGAEVATGELIASMAGVVAPLGDLAYPDGSSAAFAKCYEPAWGAFLERTRPAMGNHDARTADAGGYFELFGGLAGPEPQGYYSYELGDWHVVVLNSNCGLVGGCGPDSPQVGWLRDDLADAGTGNIVAYWHHPRFSTGEHGDDAAMATFWEVLADAGADVVLSGHDHDYQRSVPLNAAGTATDGGMTQFVVGTGGVDFGAFGEDRTTIAFRQNDTHGVLRLALDPCGYTFAFRPVGGGEPLDAGAVTDTC